MNLGNQRASDLIGKDKQKAKEAAEYILNTPDIEAWQCLIENSDYLFGYIKEKGGVNLINAANKTNVNNVFSLLKTHSTDWDGYIAEIFSKFSNEDINSRLMSLLEKGSKEEKAYAAKYFSMMPIDQAKEPLFEAAKSSYQSLKNNAAEALGKLNDEISYNYFLDRLKSEDEWEKIDAADFLASYGNNDAVYPMLEAMSTSKMAEHIAGYVATMVNLSTIFENDSNYQALALEGFDNILSGLAEIWSLSVIFDFKVYENLEKLIYLTNNNQTSPMIGRFSQLLLKAKSKVELFMDNTEYTFDEERTVLNELEEIHHLLYAENEAFWSEQVKNLHFELQVDNSKRNLAAITLYEELNLKQYAPNIVNLILKPDINDVILCEAITTLSKFGAISQISNLDSIISRIKDQNLIAIIESNLHKKV